MDNSETRLLGLFQIMSEELGSKPAGSTAIDFAVSRLRTRMRKRAVLGDSGLRNVAIQNFLSLNDHVAQVRLNIDPFILHNAKLFITEAFERYNRYWDPTLIQIAFDHRHIDRFWRFGPGASNGVRGTHTAEKIDQNMTSTLLAEPLVCRLRNDNTYFSMADALQKQVGVTLVGGSRLTTVPKNEDTDRTIAIEPSGNMALQLGFGEYIADVLRSVGLDIRDQQPLNKALAKTGSITDKIATIDMKSASDLISIPLVRHLFPRDMYSYMLRIRSPECELPCGRVVKLNMISTMGNGFTFPLMTLIFTALLYAVRLERGGPNKFVDWSSAAVFGDDIIVPSAEAPRLIQVLEDCGFIINTDKSYLSGPFRESCGGDYYEGTDVTPFYIRNLATNSDVYIAINKVFEWCAKCDILLWKTIIYLKGLINGEVYFVPEWHGDDAGFRVKQVEARYKHLAVAMRQHKAKCPMFHMMLVCGGYVKSRGSDLFYTPRPFKTRYKVRKSRLPKGYLDGSDPLSRPAPVSDYVQSYAFLLR